MLRIAGKVTSSIVDGPGFRFTVFFQGCPHKCDGCHNPQTWDMAGGKETEVSSIVEDIEAAYFVDGVTISGGEPFAQAKELVHLLKELKARDYHIIAYTGYTYEQILEDKEKADCLPYIDVLIDGRYEKDKRCLSMRFRGSSNQRVIDVPKTLESNEITLIDWDSEE